VSIFPQRRPFSTVTISELLWYAPARMEPAAPRSNFSLAGAGSVLIGTTAAVIVVCAAIGWAAGSTAWGFLAGAILGIPAGIFAVYRRYRHALS
jgi:F0F1-type ATP synthase assembly protein I